MLSLDPQALEAGNPGIFLRKPREDEKPLFGCGMWAAAWEGTGALQNREKPSRAAWILQITPSWDVLLPRKQALASTNPKIKQNEPKTSLNTKAGGALEA